MSKAKKQTKRSKKKKTMNQDKPKAIVPAGSPELILGQDSVRRAAAIARQLNDLVERQKLYSLIEGRKFIMVEGWNTLGAMLAVFPEVVSIERMPEKKVKRILVESEIWDKYSKAKKKIAKLIPPVSYDPAKHKIIPDANGNEEREIDEIKYKAIVQLKSLNGTIITKAEAICSNAETGKVANDEYAIASMAQTRATGKAFRLAFSWIVKIAGYEPTPAEEVIELQNGEQISSQPKVETQLKLK